MAATAASITLPRVTTMVLDVAASVEDVAEDAVASVETAEAVVEDVAEDVVASVETVEAVVEDVEGELLAVVPAPVASLPRRARR